MMTMAAAEQAKKEQEGGAAAHSVREPILLSRGFAASLLN